MARGSLAIDFGTASTVAVQWVENRPKLVEFDGRPSLPSTVFWRRDTRELVVGDEADRLLPTAPTRAERSPRNHLGEELLLLGDERVEVVTAVGAILRRVARQATLLLGGEQPSTVWLTHPATWEPARLDALRAAALEAALSTVVLVPEPIGVAASLGLDRLALGASIAVCCVGPGGFEASVLRRTSTSFELIGPPGVIEFAEKFDQRPLPDDVAAAVLALEGIVDDAAVRDGLVIYLAGRSARLPILAALIGQRLGVVPQVSADPGSAAAFGAALLAGATAGDPPVPDLAPPHELVAAAAPALVAAPSTAIADDLTQNPVDEDVQFTVYRPQTVQPGRWYDLLAFAHKTEPFVDDDRGELDPVEEVRRIASARLNTSSAAYAPTSADSKQALYEGSNLTFVPGADGVEFNPPSREFRWLEPVHQEEFRMRAQPYLDGQRVRGTLSVYYGSIIIAEVSMSFRVTSGAADPTLLPEQSRPYRKIFVSYSHRDVAVVEQVERWVSVFGDQFLRDSRDLRAGEVWEDRLADMINEADVFQLFWSRNSMTSQFVRQEWTYALSLQRPYFIRPTFWESPMPELPEQGLPPEELRRLHFRYLPAVLGGGGSSTTTAPAVGGPIDIPVPPPADSTNRQVAAPAQRSSHVGLPAPAAARPQPRARRSRKRSGSWSIPGATRSPVLVGLLLALVIAAPLAAAGLNSGGSSSSAPSATRTGSQTLTQSAPAGVSSSSAPAAPSCSGCQATAAAPCPACVGGQGVGSTDLGLITTGTGVLTWSSAGGRFALLLDGRVVVDSRRARGQVRLPSRSSFGDLRVLASASWSIKIF